MAPASVYLVMAVASFCGGIVRVSLVSPTPLPTYPPLPATYLPEHCPYSLLRPRT